MFSSPWTVVGVGIYEAGAALKVRYTNRNDGAMPLAPWVYFQGFAPTVAFLY